MTLSAITVFLTTLAFASRACVVVWTISSPSQAPRVWSLRIPEPSGFLLVTHCHIHRIVTLWVPEALGLPSIQRGTPYPFICGQGLDLAKTAAFVRSAIPPRAMCIIARHSG